jgi:peptidoglycan/LPS O-acetylase OafA/YrhL
LKPRIQTLDGLRFLAALGVLWIHTWTIHGNPRFYVGRIDLADFLAIGVNGVELFFVISGFCMYYFYANKPGFSYHDFYRFLVKRWFRLSPAFYVVTLVYILVGKYIYHYDISIVGNMVHSLFYFNYILGQYQTASHFWTLTVEWQFYILIPFVLIYQQRIGFIKTFSIIFGAVVLCGVLCVVIFKQSSDYFAGTLLLRGVEFGFGVLVARMLNSPKTYFSKRVLWFILFLIITYAGRTLISKKALDLSVNYYNLFKLAGFTLMGAGFAGIVYLSLTSTRRLKAFLSNRLFRSLGRISYSFYLLHALIFPVVAHVVMQHLPSLKGIAAPMFSTLISVVILYPLSLLSYHLLEKPFLSIGNLTTK